MVREVLNRMPEAVKKQMEVYKQDYKKYKDADRFCMEKEVMMRAGGYVKGLRDAGLVTKKEAQALYIYTIM